VATGGARAAHGDSHHSLTVPDAASREFSSISSAVDNSEIFLQSRILNGQYKLRPGLVSRSLWSITRRGSLYLLLQDRLSGNGGITAAPMHPTIAPHQIDVMKSHQTCQLAAFGSSIGFIAGPLGVGAGRTKLATIVYTWTERHDVGFMVCVLARPGA
jgi:hypothetical protein